MSLADEHDGEGNLGDYGVENLRHDYSGITG